MPLTDFDHPDDWARDLDARWPERERVRNALVDVIGSEIARLPDARVLELGFGTGALLSTLARRFEHAELVGIDRDEDLRTLATQRMPGVQFIAADLADPSWIDQIGGRFNVIYTMQTLHDLGGRDALETIYRTVTGRLKPGGMFLNADFVVPLPRDNPKAPRRFAAPVHEALLRACGFEDVGVVLACGMLACVRARMPLHAP